MADNTSFQLPKALRDRLKVVAAKERLSMLAWLEKQVSAAEKRKP